MFSEYLSWINDHLITPLFNFALPWGVTFGAIVVAVFGLPLVVRAFKKFF